jgi:predicted HD superfamily hydrolase involved in NAD metabolism
LIMAWGYSLREPPYELLERELEERITGRRFSHSIGVRDTAAALAGMYGCDEEKARAASLLHDVARDMPLATMKEIVTTQGDVTTQSVVSGQNDTLPREALFSSPGLLHAYAGRIIAQRDFGVRDADILRSIELHTTGGRGMTVLNKVVFVADYIEPGRSFRGVETARAIAKRSLDETVLYIFRSMFRKLIADRVYICVNTLLGYNELVLGSGNTVRDFPM